MNRVTIQLLRSVGACGLVAVLAACGARAHCSGEQPHMKAESVSILEEVDDIRVPRSSGALTIPEGDFDGPLYATEYEDDRGRARIRCLDSPPALPELIEGEGEGDDGEAEISA